MGDSDGRNGRERKRVRRETRGAAPCQDGGAPALAPSAAQGRQAVTSAERGAPSGHQGPTYTEIAQAVEAAKGTLLRIEMERGPGDALRYFVRDCEAERVVKRFRAHQVPVDVLRWIDEKYPQGVFMTSTIYGERWTLRFRYHTWTYDSWQRALKHAGTSAGNTG